MKDSIKDANFKNLKQILKKQTILYPTTKTKIVDSKGRSLPWIYYHWNTSLSSLGARLTAACILEVLKKFRSHQLASYGYTSLPIITACITLDENYSGLAIRKKRENHGTCNLIEGLGDHNSSVVVIDDCISSGSSLYEAIKALEMEGYTVEGAICVVKFPWSGGVEWAKSLGYKIETIFDVYDDFEMPIKAFQNANQNIFPTWDDKYQIQDGLSPADTSQRMIAHFLRYNLIPKPPNHFDKDYDGKGGVFVSLRDKQSDYRIARDGFYNLSSNPAHLPRDLALSTFKIASVNKDAIIKYGFEKLKVGVSLIGKHEQIKPSQLNFKEYGIMAQSNVQSWKVGGALPNTQFFTSEIEQFFHCVFTNAGITHGASSTRWLYTQDCCKISVPTIPARVLSISKK